MPGCTCREPHDRRRIALTGGPGAGKTAVLELLRLSLCRHVHLVPEAATMLFRGGFPQRDGPQARAATQRAIYHVQRELEALAEVEGRSVVSLCDRGTVDALAYWPLAPEEFWSTIHSTREEQLARYAAVIHLRVPPPANFDHANPVRRETAAEAAAIDARIAAAWEGHPRRRFVESSADFFEKVARAVALIRAELPECCRAHVAEAARLLL